MWDRTTGTLRALRLLLGVGLALALPGVARAATITVTNTNDSGVGSLRAAVTASGAGDTIDFAQGLAGTITLSGPLSITHALTITGPGAGIIDVDGNNRGTAFDINATSGTDAVAISGLTITGGAFSGSGPAAGGGGIDANAVHTLTLSGVVVTGNQATVSGGAVNGGGGVYVNGAPVTITDSVISGNTVTLTGATGGDGGGGLYSDGGAVTATGSVITENTVDQTNSSNANSDGGGGIYSDGGAVSLTDTVVDNNTDSVDSSRTGSDGGGGIYSNGGDVTLQNAFVDSNTFSLGTSGDGFNGGGGIFSGGGNVTVTSSSIDDDSLRVSESSTLGNDGGGGIFSDGGTIAVSASSISGNSSTITTSGGDSGGGAVLDASGLMGTYVNSTLSSNSTNVSSPDSDNGGGAIFTLVGGLASDLTIAANTINQPGGGILSQGTFQLKNTIIADNAATPAGNCAAVSTGGFSSDGFNLESGNTCDLNATGDLANTEPQLGPLQNNGGLTLTQALNAGSPAIDTGSCTDIAGNAVATDQRGVPRPEPAGGRCDIGAYELIPTQPGGPPPPRQPSPPAATPAPPAVTSSTGATFSGSVNPEGLETTAVFQYGIDLALRGPGASTALYDQSTPPQALPADSSVHAVSASASRLVPNALYHVRLVATNATGTTFGPDQTFTTPAGPVPPPPVLGQSVNANPVSGHVFVLVGTTLVPLTELSRLPSGATVDARAGSLQLTAATGMGHKRETGVFGGAIFKLTQAHSGLTTLSLAEGALAGAPSYASCKAHKTADATATALSSKTLQLLHASAHGRFRTSGRYSAATVRGTKWTIADRCDGTLTHDLTDSVLVSDFVRHRTIVLHAGQSYLARAPGRK